MLAPLMPTARRGGRPRTTDMREVMNAQLYLLRTGCQWRMLPKDFPPHPKVYGRCLHATSSEMGLVSVRRVTGKE